MERKMTTEDDIPTILSKQRARIAELESEREDFDAALEAAHSAARRLQSQCDVFAARIVQLEEALRAASPAPTASQEQ